MNFIKGKPLTAPKIYRFGPHNHTFTGDNMEWCQLKNVIAYWHEEMSKYPYVTVMCPHCGAKNTHKIDSNDGHPFSYGRHRECLGLLDEKGRKMIYDCPGYHIVKYEGNNSDSDSDIDSDKEK